MRIITSTLFCLCSLIASAQGIWDAKTSLPSSARQSAFAFEIGGFGFVGTGNYAPGPVYLSDLWRYNPANDSWVQKASFPLNVARSVAVVINGIAYAGTGFNSSGNFNTWYSYDPVADLWTQKANFPGTARQDAFAVAVNGKAYVGGGVFSTNPNVFQDLWEYNPATDSWTQKGSLPSPRAFATEFVINNKAYLVGGTVAPGSWTNEVHEYNPVTDTWTAKAPLPVIANELVSFAINGKGYVGLGSSAGTLLSQWYEYNPVTDQWQSVASFPGAVRTQSIAFAAGNSGYVFAGRGSSQNYLNDLWRFTPDTATGINDPLIGNSLFSIFPNPSAGTITIRCDESPADISVFDTKGRLVFQQNSGLQPINQLMLHHLENGLYTVTVTGKTAIRTSVISIVK